jgi:hypothetical protein
VLFSVPNKDGVTVRQPKVALRKREAEQPVQPAETMEQEQPMELEETMELEEGVDVLVQGVDDWNATPAGVRDIDGEDLTNPQLCGEYAQVDHFLSSVPIGGSICLRIKPAVTS